MGCIPELLKKYKEKSPLYLNRGVIFESGGSYKGYDYCVTFTDMGNRCGYVAIPESHPLYNVADEDDFYEFSVHGGITFAKHPNHLVDSVLPNHGCADKWLGFDVAHYGDGRDVLSLKKYFPDPDCIEAAEFFNESSGSAEIRNNSFMVEQCKQLIDQICDKHSNPKHKRLSEVLGEDYRQTATEQDYKLSELCFDIKEKIFTPKNEDCGNA